MRIRSRPLSIALKLLLAGLIAYVVVDAFQAQFLGVSPLRFFTIQSNILVGIVCLSFAAVEASARGRLERRGQGGARLVRIHALLRGVPLLAISITGIVFNLLLAQLLPRVDFANQVAHTMVPIGFVLDWLLFAPKGRFRYRDVAVWVVYPVLYLAGTLVAGAWGNGFYPYPFLNVALYGYGAVARNAAVMLVVFSLLGLLYVWIDRALGWVGRRRIEAERM